MEVILRLGFLAVRAREREGTRELSCCRQQHGVGLKSQMPDLVEESRGGMAGWGPGNKNREQQELGDRGQGSRAMHLCMQVGQPWQISVRTVMTD